ncbi:hypothetical protein [Rhodoferax ferrireducens]|uniref:hypothetical protein n=1 Tax=Rhodoferax ferrireducens TaxID=192843 RepID=UPI00130026EE|nr:hypothetical protein [Rhodoferax ferrireducens]
MHNRTVNAIFLVASCALSTGAGAQNTYKCGNTYSQLPCTGGVVIDTSDQRTPAQKTQADLATDRNAQTAAAMEKARLRQEEMDIAANTAPPPKAHTAAVKRSSATQTKARQKQKKKEPEYFAAQVPGEKATKKVPNKSTKAKSASKT